MSVTVGNTKYKKVIPQVFSITNKGSKYDGRTVHEARWEAVTSKGRAPYLTPTGTISVLALRKNMLWFCQLWEILRVLYSPKVYYGLGLNTTLGTACNYYRGAADATDLHSVVMGSIPTADEIQKMVNIAEQTVLRKGNKEFPITRLVIHSVL